MPYGLRRVGKKWEVYNLDTGEVRGHVPTRRQGQRMIEAIYANTGEGRKGYPWPSMQKGSTDMPSGQPGPS